MKHLILGFATNQEAEHLLTFARSVRRSLPPDVCDVVIATNADQVVPPELHELEISLFSTTSCYRPGSPGRLKLWNRVLMRPAAWLCGQPGFARRFPEMVAGYRVVAEALLHPHIARWMAYERFLALHGSRYDQVFLTDIRDVAFQGSPFPEVADQAVWLFSQDALYGQDACDSGWYETAYGAKALGAVRGKEALCIGTVLGPTAQVARFTSELATYFAREPFGRVEQAAFNWLYHSGAITAKTQVMRNVEGPVATLSKPELLSRIRVTDGGILRDGDGTLIPVVHMYDRHAPTAAAIARLFGSEHMTPAT